MNNTELKKKISSEATDIEWFKNLEIEIRFDYINYVKQIKGVSALFEFVNQQIKGWEKLGTNIPTELEQSKIYFVNIKNNIESFVNKYITYNSTELGNYWRNTVQNGITSVHQFPFLYENPETNFLLEIYQTNNATFQGSWQILTANNNTISMSSRKENLYGMILALEFLNKDKTGVGGRIGKERKSISELKNNFIDYLSRSESELLEHFKNGNLKFEEYAEQIDTLKTEKETIFNTWFENTKTVEWEKWYADKQAHILSLESTYKEKLKLEEPAKYWKDRGTELKKQGWDTLKILVCVSLLSCLSLWYILVFTPEQIYTSFFQSDKSAAIRWTIIYVMLISFFAYLIRILAKTMFSSFHLARDSEERYTLTYFYLSLLKDSSVDEKDKHLIMQSLFSRAETGLLKDDSSPSMPNSIDFSKFFKN